MSPKRFFSFKSSLVFLFSSSWIEKLFTVGASFIGFTVIVAVATFILAVLSSVASKVKVSVPLKSWFGE